MLSRYYLAMALKVVFASHVSSLQGGAERSLLELALALKKDGRIAPVVTVPRDGALAARLRAESIPTAVLPTRWWALPSESYRLPVFVPGVARPGWKVLGMALNLGPWCRWLRAARPDVVVTNTAVIPVPALACAIVGVPHVWRVHEFVTKDHGLRYVLGEAFSRRTIGWTSKVVVVNSQAVRDHYSPPIPRDKVRVLDQAITGFQPTPNAVDPPNVRALVLGALAPTKGIPVALEAAKILVAPPAPESAGGPAADSAAEPVRLQLRLVGPVLPSYRQELDRLVATLGIGDCVEIRQATPTPQIELAWANVLVMCSDNEAFGRVTVEGLKSGRPVVGTRSGGTVELVFPGVNGLLFSPGDAQELAAALRTLAGDPAMLERMSENAIASTEGRFTTEEEVEEFVAVLTQAAGRERGTTGEGSARPQRRRA